MSWVTIALRKMTLTQRISDIEFRLTQLSQSQQSAANASSYAMRELTMTHNRELSQNNLERNSQITAVRGTDMGSISKQEALSMQQEEIDNINLNHEMTKMMSDSIFQAQSDTMSDEVNRATTQMQLQQQQLQDQLAAARAEKEQLQGAMDQDIKDGAIKLT